MLMDLDHSFDSQNQLTVTVVTGVCMIIGLFLIFGGHLLVQPVLFIIGSLLFGSLALHVIAFLQSKQMIHLTESNVSMVVIITFLVAGAIGGGIALCLTSLACYILGASIGYVVGAFVLNLPVAASLENTGRLGVLFAFILVGLLGGKVIEKWIFVIGSALIGSYAFCVGLDHYVKSGIFIILRNSIVDKKPPTISGIGVGMLALFVVLPVIGAAFQFNQIQKRKLQGVGYSNLKG
ncbi:hypothetical protein BC833DRAFT_580519 [Globomyces pollinis-pini]|nr:hypothetical protein BC833DRAFT_580519 [Globomyces pollinis-pini]